VIFSDGVTDACDPQGDDFGESRLAAVIAEHRNEGSVEIVQAVNRAIAEFTAGTPLPDDLTLLVARRTG
jgi:serine phosphatase RsbU (regulator of sigma subunit)